MEDLDSVDEQQPWLLLNVPNTGDLTSTEEQQQLEYEGPDSEDDSDNRIQEEDTDSDDLDSSFSSDVSQSSFSTLSIASPDRETSPGNQECRRRPSGTKFLPRKRMRLLPPRQEPMTVSGPYIVYMLKEEEIDEDWTLIKNSLTSFIEEK